MVGTGNDLVSRVEHLNQSIVVVLVDLDQIYLARHKSNMRFGGIGSEDAQRTCDGRGSTECSHAREARPEAWCHPAGEHNRCDERPADEARAHRRLRCLPIAAYTQLMIGVDDQAAPAEMLPAQSDTSAPIADPVSPLAAVYRDYPGLRALILRRVRDPEVAADILQDAAVTTLEKLRSGEIAHPENLGGYLYRVALNHLRNHRRKDRSALSSADALEELPASENDLDWENVRERQWASAARRMLEEMPVPRDRDILIRFYLDDEDREKICRELGLSEEHFNRVIFRARNRFRELIEHRGFRKADLLTIAVMGFCIWGGQSNGLFLADQATQTSNASAALVNTIAPGALK
jgi:RNA polymerase sigma-70 factor, ECF subfamily